MLFLIPFRYSGKHGSEDKTSLSHTVLVYERVIHLISSAPCHTETQLSGKTVGQFYK